MGDVADMILDGLLDEVTGEYIGDQNKQIYGTEAPGFPITYEGKKHRYPLNNQPTKGKVVCPICKKRVKEVGLRDHQRDKHRTHSQ